ncbi:MAG: hypothetical protein AAF244_03990, partial [Pseudomonadota bacterium]
GFVCGFFVGQFLLLRLLKDRPTEELLNNKSLKWTYGVLNWIIAGIGAYSFVFLYQYYIAG